MANADDNTCITRVDVYTENGKSETHGWEVRVHRRGESVEKFYSDSVLGGKRRALAAARAFRDETVAVLKPYSRLEIAQQPNSRNTSGVIGVHYTKHPYKKRGRVYECEAWVATWSPEPNVERNKKFSVKKLGDVEAYNRAVQFRQEVLKKLAEQEGSDAET